MAETGNSKLSPKLGLIASARVTSDCASGTFCSDAASETKPQRQRPQRQTDSSGNKADSLELEVRAHAWSPRFSTGSDTHVVAQLSSRLCATFSRG